MRTGSSKKRALLGTIAVCALISLPAPVSGVKVLATKSPVGLYKSSDAEIWRGDLTGEIAVTDKDEKAVSGAKIRIYYGETLIGEGTCAENGRLTVNYLKKGTAYRIEANKDPYGEITREYTPKEDGEELKIRLPGRAEESIFQMNYLFLLLCIICLLLAVLLLLNTVLKKRREEKESEGESEP